MSDAPERAAPLAWERRPEETAKAYRAFLVYRDLDPAERSIDAAYELYIGRELPPGRRAAGHFAHWAGQHAWVRRALAWDSYERQKADQAKLEADRRAIEDMRRRHITASLSLQQKALEALQKIDTKTLTPFVIIRALVEATKLERLSRGEPDAITEERLTAGDPGHQHPSDPDGILDRILADPDALRAARDLAFALQGASVEGDAGDDSAPPQ